MKTIEMTKGAPIKEIWMIDDSTIDLMIYARIIKRSGLVEKTVQFSFAQEALDRLGEIETDKPDAVLLDINMPVIDGFTFLERAVETHGPDFTKILLVMLTTSISKQDRLRARSFPVVKGYLLKPLIETHLKQIAKICESGSDVPPEYFEVLNKNIDVPLVS